ncbi:MAG: XTP/dITP diphosphatase [Clostridia bacterium]|nr:XTP/dITP diphosphatase [Clostridia bacterium]
MKIIAATNNRGKLMEIEEITSGLGVRVSSLSDEGIKIDVEETGKTFEENALIKARAVYEITRTPVLADDSGLCVDALSGAPGVYTARYAGEGASDDANISKLLSAMRDADEENRTARFVCALAYIDESGREHVYRGECEGVITFEKKGTGGMGYDPVFYYPPYKMTFAECSHEMKNAVSHRSAALKKFFDDMKIK